MNNIRARLESLVIGPVRVWPESPFFDPQRHCWVILYLEQMQVHCRQATPQDVEQVLNLTPDGELPPILWYQLPRDKAAELLAE